MPVPWAPAELLQFFGPGSPFGGGLGSMIWQAQDLQVARVVRATAVAGNYVVNLERPRSATLFARLDAA